jgi:glycosyltransferase involved in cell wall biosynthesis
LRVLLNLLVAAGKKTGIGHYACELVRALRAQSPDDRFEEFPGPLLGWCWQTGNRLRSLLDRKKPMTGPPAHPRARSSMMGSLRGFGQFFISGQFRRLMQANHFDLYHEPNYIPLPCAVPTIATIPDLSIMLHPQWHPRDRVVFFEQNLPRALDRCTHLIAISEFCRQEILRTFSLPPEKVSCTYLGVRPGLTVLPSATVAPALRALGLPPRYLLYLGTLEPRKNLLTLLKAYCSLPAQLRDRWPLVLAGGWGWNTAEIRDYFHNEARHRGVIHLGYLPDDHITAVYNGARALVYPSHYEGFGLPPIEMMACGGAVLASTAGAHQEILGDRACLIAPDDQDGWREAMRRVVEDDAWWQSLRHGVIDHVQPFTWERCAETTRQVYWKVISARAAAA